MAKATKSPSAVVAAPHSNSPDAGGAASGAPSATATPSLDAIARRAYEIFQARGGVDGHHDDDWLQAERELKLGRQ